MPGMRGEMTALGHERRKSLITVAGLGVRLAGHSILSGVDLELSGGEIVSLIGPNGAGKTTLIRAMLGLVPHQQGRVNKAPDLVIGYMPQRLTLDPVLPLTVRRFLRMAAKAKRAEILNVLGEVGVPQLLEAQLQTLSGGEFQRVLLARALLRDPDLLVLDEPAQQVDFQGQIDMFELIEDVRRTRGCGVLVVSHDLHMVMRATDRVLCLNGHICCSGAPEAVSAHPEYVALFGPRAAESVALYHHHHRHAHDLAGEVLPLDAARSQEPLDAARSQEPIGSEPPESPPGA